MDQKTYIAIDLKSFYASVECIERHLDPMDTNLVVADRGRTEKTICLAVTPSLKGYGISGRARMFEAVAKVKEVNEERRRHAGGRLRGKSYSHERLLADPALAVDFLVAQPRMALYMQYSTRIYQIYLRHVAPEDIHVYSVDEVFIDATAYLARLDCTAEEFTKRIILDVYQTTGITATAGIGTNLYLCKVALDIMAKHAEPDENGIRVGALDEMSYRRQLWSHRPITDFWRVGRGYAKTLEEHGMFTMGDIARCSLGKGDHYYNEELLYRLFGINAELLIDHAWGWEPCELHHIKAYRPESNSLCSGQVLQTPYPFEKAKLVAREMADLLALELVDQGLITDQIVLTVGYDIENLSSAKGRSDYQGEVSTDHYGRRIPKHAHGTANLDRYTASSKCIVEETVALFDRIVQPKLTVRRLNITANHVIPEGQEPNRQEEAEQLCLFEDVPSEREDAGNEEALEKEKRMQKTMIEIKKKYGKNAILKGMNLEEGATAKERNRQIGGHRA